MGWKCTYLGRLYRHKKTMFWLITLLITGHLVPVFLNYQPLTPFYLWSMYTLPAHPADTFSVFHIEYNEGKTIARQHTYRDLGRMMWTYTLPKYDAFLRSGDTLPVQTRSARLLTKIFSPMPHAQPVHVTAQQLAAYPAWLIRYLEQETNERIYRLSVQEVKLVYGADGRPYEVTSKKILQLP